MMIFLSASVTLDSFWSFLASKVLLIEPRLRISNPTSFSVTEMSSIFRDLRMIPIYGMLRRPFRLRVSLALFQRKEDVSPKIACITKVIGETDVCHAGFRTTSHGLQLRDDIFKAKGFTDSLCACGFAHDVDDVDVEVVVSGLVCVWSAAQCKRCKPGR